MNLTKEVKNLCNENHKTWTRKTEEATKEWKDTLCSRIGKNNIVKMSTLIKAIYRFDAIPINISMAGLGLWLGGRTLA